MQTFICYSHSGGWIDSTNLSLPVIPYVRIGVSSDPPNSYHPEFRLKFGGSKLTLPQKVMTRGFWKTTRMLQEVSTRLVSGLQAQYTLFFE